MDASDNNWIILVQLPLAVAWGYFLYKAVRFWTTPLGAFRPRSYHFKRIALTGGLFLVSTGLVIAALLT